MDGEELWEHHAEWWQETFTQGRDAEYEELILPLVDHFVGDGRRVLDIGCGEGQVARRLDAAGAEVLGIDPSSTQIRAADERSARARFVRARAEALPCADGAFDTVVLCLALEHVDPFELAIDEVARVLRPGGRFVLLLAHPFLQAPGSGWVDGGRAGERYWRIGSYLGDEVAIDEVAPGIRLPFAHRPLSRYVHAMGQSGLVIDDMVEPPPPPAVVAETAGFDQAATIPRVLLLCARRTD